jgi:para-aminobenzoate synthetase component I
MRRFIRIQNKDPLLFGKKLVCLEKEFSDLVILDSNNYNDSFYRNDPGKNYKLLAGAGVIERFDPEGENLPCKLDEFISGSKDWLFGHLAYDLKNKFDNLASTNPDRIGFSLMSFFTPRFIFRVTGDSAEVGWDTKHDDESTVRDLLKQVESVLPNVNPAGYEGKITPVVSRNEYLQTIAEIKNHIRRGDIYEINYCKEFYSLSKKADPANIWINLIQRSPTPFSSFYKRGEKYLLCSSPERFMKKSGNTIISQPIKGTAARGSTYASDTAVPEKLYNDPKERAENIMITDLVRNDLSRIAASGSVKVEELCGIHPFPGVFQMQSTISATLAADISTGDIIKAMFPMGSMTGAPKIRAMELIEKYEKSRRGLYSGSIGYITPEMDFDFNVVIRSILYDSAAGNLSFSVGGAITDNSVPEREYDECMLKAAAMIKTLGGMEDLTFRE